jgi:hypothetical protein
MRCILLSLALLLLVGAPAKANVYYVSPSGSDANSCAAARASTPSAQKLTISAGVRCLVAGDTLYIRGGTYRGALNSINSGTSTVNGGTDFGAGAITIAAYPGETVTLIVGAGVENAITLTSAAQRYLIFDRLILDGTGMGPLLGGLYQGNGSAHIRFQNGEIKNSPGIGILTSATAGGDLQILNSHIHHNGVKNSPQLHNIYLKTTDNLIDGNEIDHAAYFGLTIYNTSSPPSRNIVRRNSFHDNCAYGGAEIGINGGANNAVYGNLVYGSSTCYGIDVQYSSPGATLVYSNTVVLNGGIHIGADATNTSVKNNIVRKTNNAGPGLIDNAGVGSVIANNLMTDPAFVNPGANNFHLQPGSSAIDAGATLASVPFDHDGVPLPQGQAYDIGAFEYLPSSGAGPPPPTHVRTL